MIKKILLLMLCIFSINVCAKEIEDKVIIKKQHVSMSFLDENKYFVSNQYDVYSILGITPNERYFYKLLKDDYIINNNNIKLKHEYDNISIESKKEYGMNKIAEGLLINIGEGGKLIDEQQNITINWEVKTPNNEDNIYYITNEQYEINELSFEILYPGTFVNKKVLFSKNNFDFNQTMNGLSYSIEKNILLKGKYSNKLDENDFLVFKIVDNNNILDNNYYTLIIIISIVLCIFVIGIYIFKKGKLRKS